MRFKLCIILIVILIFLFSGIGTAKEFGKHNNPRIVIETQKGPLNIWAFYDTGLQMLCYVTEGGKTMSCTPYHNLASQCRDRIDKHLEKYNKGTNPAPSIIHVP